MGQPEDPGPDHGVVIGLLADHGVKPSAVGWQVAHGETAQAVNAFASFEPEPGLKFDKIYEVYSQRFRREDLGEDEKFDAKVMPAGYLLDPQAGHAFVYVCTIQRMAINLFGRQAAFEPGDDEGDDDAEQLDIPIHAFDLIIADECHRGYTSAELSRLAKHPRTFRRHQSRPDRHAGGPHESLF